jgi:hypothetical protein
MILVAVQFDRQPSIVSTLYDKVDRIAPDRNLWTDAVTQIEQTFTELAFDRG